MLLTIWSCSVTFLYNYFPSLNQLLSEFDKYYIINYREFGKGWKTLSEDKDDNDVSDSRSGTLIFTCNFLCYF